MSINTALEIERRDIDSLKPSPHNSRLHSPLQIQQITESLRQFGWTMPILIDENDGIIAGHGRILAAKALELTHVPVIVARNWSEPQTRAYIIADNQLALNANWDNLKLAQELEWLGLANFDTKLIGFSDAELATLFSVTAPLDAQQEWRAMPQFNNEKIAFRDLIMHFKDDAAVQAFAQLLGQEIGEMTKSLWYPAQARETHATVYRSESEGPSSTDLPADILSEVTKHSVQRYLARCAKFTPIDIPTASAIISNLFKQDRGEAIDETQMGEFRRLEKKWLDAMNTDAPDYAAYGDPYYFCDVWTCWVTYSRKYLKEIQKDTSCIDHSIVADMVGVERALDLGCSFAYTTAALAQIFPDAEVIGTNFPGTAQWAMAQQLAAERGFEVVESFENLTADLIFMSEYMEHQRAPIEHMAAVLDHCKPKYMLIASTFTSPAIGHFTEYFHEGVGYPGEQISKMLNKYIRSRGYAKVETKCWNGRPAYWKLAT